MKSFRIYVLIIPLLFGIFISSYLWSIYGITSKNIAKKNIEQKPIKNIFNDIALEARAVFVYDVKENKVLFAKNEERQIPLASFTKVMTALVAFKDYKKNKMITVRRENLEEEGDSGLSVDERWNLKNLTDFTLISSSNDGANMLASVGVIGAKNSMSTNRAIFIKKMNKLANKLKMSQTYFLNESGLDFSKTTAGAYGSAKDMTILFSYILKNYPNLLEATTYKNIKIKSSEKLHKAKNTDNIIDKIPGIIASKTGFTDLSGGNLIIAYDAGPMHPIIISVMGSSVKGRFTDVNKLVKASLVAIRSN